MPAVESHLRSYLEARFPEYRVGEEWERSRNVLVFRLEASGHPTLLVEVSPKLLEMDSEDEVEGLLAWWNIADMVREHYRVLVDHDSVKPLPWKQLAPEESAVDEASWESFPASDAAPPSTFSRSEDED